MNKDAKSHANGAPSKESKPRRTKGQGSVFERGGVWYAELRFRGKRYCWSSRSTRKTDATNLLDENRRKIISGTYTPNGASVTLRHLREIILARVQADGRKYGPRVESCFAHLERLLGKDTPADRIGDSLEHYVATRLAEKIGKPEPEPGPVRAGEERKMVRRTITRATVNRELGCLRRAFRLMVKRRRLATMPEIELLAENNVRTRLPSDDEVRAVLGELSSGLHDALHLLSIVPWRVREALNLTWRQVDEKLGAIRQEAAEYKSGREARVLPYAAHPVLAALIAGRRRLTDTWQREHGAIVEHVFWYEGEDEHGQPTAVPYSEYAQSWKRACKRAKVADFHVHDLKRYAARAMVRAGVDEVTIMKLAGWRTRSMFDRYSIRNERDLVDGMRRLAQAAQQRLTKRKAHEA